MSSFRTTMFHNTVILEVVAPFEVDGITYCPSSSCSHPRHTHRNSLRNRLLSLKDDLAGYRDEDLIGDLEWENERIW